MKVTISAAAVFLAGAAFVSTPAAAQQNYGAQPAQNVPEGQQQQQAAPQSNAPQPKVTRQAAKPLQELNAAIKANNTAEIPAKIAAAEAAVKSADDKYMLGALRYKAAVAAKDDTARAAAIEAMLASGFEGIPRGQLLADLGATYARLKQNDRSLQAYQQALQLDPNSVEATAGVAEAKAAAGQTSEALALLQKGIQLQSAGGAKAPEAWYKRALAIAYKAKVPAASDLARQWVAAYPSKDSWHDALAIYQNVVTLDETHTLDLLRLKRATGVLGGGDYFNYADIAVRKGLSGEAKAVLEEGFAAKTVNPNDASFKQIYALASQKTQGDKASLPAAPVASASAQSTLTIGDAWYGYGDYTKAAEFYRAALSKPQANASLINLHLGMALARQGDKAGATAALNAVSGTESALAKYWLTYLATKA
jgi:tetratricopeptide (TPR) repeat protein